MGSWHLEVPEGSDTMTITCSGVMTAELFDALAREALALANARGIAKFLADHREMAPAVTTAEIAAIPESVRLMGLPAHARVAVVTGRDSPWLREFRFLENVAHNRNVPYRIFATPEEAIAWLGTA